MNQSDQQDTMDRLSSESPRIGVYICHCGGNISDVVDVEKVVQAAAPLSNVAIARREMFMCSDAGQQRIADDIHEKKLDRVVVAACSPSLHELTFRRTLTRAGLNPYLYEHVNIREQVSWCSKSDEKGATDKAIRLVEAGVAKARLLRSLKPIHVDAKQQAAVIGGGVSGLRAALDLARSNLGVHLIEQSPFLGGRMAQLTRTYPDDEDARQLLERLMQEVEDHPGITVYTCAEVVATSGYVGNFQLRVRLHPRGVRDGLTPDQVEAAMAACPESIENAFEHGLERRKAIYRTYPGCRPATAVIDWEACTRCGQCVEAVGGQGITLDAEPEEVNLHTGAIIMATGFDLYQPRQNEYGYGTMPEVITLPQMIRLLDKTDSTQKQFHWNGRPVQNIGFIHCVGSRQIAGIHEPDSDSDGQLNEYCSRVCCTATLQAAVEIKKRFSDVNVFDFYQDIRTYGRGHEPIYEEACDRGVTFFRYHTETPPSVSRAEEESPTPLWVQVRDTLTFGEEIEVPADLVVLAVGMVPRDITKLIDMLKLPRSADGFLQEVHPKLRPVELAVKGIFLAGPCQAPMDITESCAAASAAAAKAVALLGKGNIALDPFVAQVDPNRCQGEGRCVEECKYRRAITLTEDPKTSRQTKLAEVNPALCSGCGMCAAVCPHGAIQVEGWRLDQFEAMVKAIAADHPQVEKLYA